MASSTKGRGEQLVLRVLLGLLLLTPLVFRSQALQKGQPIKQFFAYSISESLIARGPLHTQLPCTPVRTWAEEPPLFHVLAAPLTAFGPDASYLLPWLSFVSLGVALWFLGGLRLAVVGVATPIVLRYSIQHLPDLLAVSFLVWGLALLVRKRPWGAWVLFLLAVTAKVLTLFAIAPVIGAYAYRQRSWKPVWACALLALPFLMWLMALHWAGTPNPFRLNSLLDNRHSGTWSLLWQPAFYLKFNLWVGIKGCGLVVWFFALVEIFRKGEKSRSALDPFVMVWALGVIPYWVIVRQGNLVHDYYSLPFVLPFVALALRRIERLSSYAFWACLGVHLVLGVGGLYSMKALGLGPHQVRPTFCGMEMGQASAPHRRSALVIDFFSQHT